MSKSSEVIRRLAEIGTQTMIKEGFLPPAQASVVMREIAYRFAREFGGTEPYIPKANVFLLEKRDLLLLARIAEGASTNDVGKEFGITQRQARSIVKQARDQRIASQKPSR